MKEREFEFPFAIELWEQTPAPIQAFLVALTDQLAQTRELLEAQSLRIAQLEEKLALTSQNSDKPPSTDQKPRSPKPPRKKSGRKRGGQPGHSGKTRMMLPPEEVAHTVVCKPEQCEHCNLPLGGLPARVGRHQVMDLPPIQPVVTEYQVWTCDCPHCGKSSKAVLPQGTPESTYGPRIVAMSGLLSGAYHLSKRQVQQIMNDFFGVPISLGSISNNEKHISRAFESTYEDLADRLPQEKVLYIDETRFDKKNQKGWLWTFVGQDFCFHQIRENRQRTLLEELVGADFGGIVVSDRYRAYEYFSDDSRQSCWAHLVREFERWKLRGGESEQIGKVLQEQTEWMFGQWHRVRDGTLERGSFAAGMEEVKKKVKEQLELGSKCEHKKTKGTSVELLKHFESLWTFVRVEGVEPTNNAAERALRPAVIYRKRCFGVDSTRGARFVERIQSVVSSLKMQKKNLLAFVSQAVDTLFRKEAPPSLLPHS